MDTSPNLSLPLIAAAQAQKHVTHNEAIVALDALVQLSVADRTRTLPPSDPVEGDRHIVGAPASAGWTGWDGSVALYSSGGWLRLVPRPGWLAWIAEEAALVIWNGTEWQAQTAAGSSLMLGVNALADMTSRLAVKSDEILFSHDDVTPGSGSLRLTANKASTIDTASILFKTNWSSRAEIGLAGSDALSIKVSPDGAAWIEALSIDPATGIVSLPATPTATRVLTAEDTSGTSMPDLTYTDQAFATTSRNDFGNAAWDGSLFTVPQDGTYDFGASLAVDGMPSATSAYFYRNGTELMGFSEISGISGQNTIASRAVVTLTAGDTISVRMRHNAGSSQLGLASALFSIIQF